MTPVYNAFVYIVWFLATFYSVFFFLSLLIYRNSIFEERSPVKGKPLVSVLVPAYNEEEKIADTISSLKALTYPNVEIIIINDGSGDRTSAVVRESISGDERFTFVDNADNRGKAAALNQGIGVARGKYVACMDADSIVEPGIIEKALPYFGRGVGAVTVSVAVRNPKSFLERIIAVEYVLGLSLFLKIFSFLDCICVTPGPFSIYTRKALQKLGGFDPSNITEDMEIAYRLHREGFSIRNCIEAKVHTTLPPSFRKIYVQRRRWYSGSINTLFQHRDMMLNLKYRFFGFFMPFNFMLIFLGLGLFLSSLYLLLSSIFQTLVHYSYTNFNFLDHLSFGFNILNYGLMDILGLSIFLTTIAIMIVSVIFARHGFRNRAGLLGYPFIFFLYQVFWLGSILAVVNRKKVKWR